MSENPVPFGGPAPVPVMQCPIAGFQYHGGEACWSRMGAGDALALRREPGNRHDPRAITVEWQGVMLGYVPREANYALSQMMDRGERVAGRVRSLRAAGDPWLRVMMEVVWLPAGVRIEKPPDSQPGRAPVLQAPEVLVRSLANRVFGAKPSARAIDWVANRVGALALVGVEHPGMLPFLRLVEADKSAALHTDPLAALHGLLTRSGIDQGAWKRLERWGFAAFEALEGLPAPNAVARYANLLFGIDLQSPPPKELARSVLTIARYRQAPNAVLDLERYPVWFMRAFAKALESAKTAEQRLALSTQVRHCLDWLIEARPSPDGNQQHAGWEWMVKQGRLHRIARELDSAIPWEVPVGDMKIGEWWVVPLRNPGELVAEAKAMQNCLAEYVEDCRSGNFGVFSIRHVRSDVHHACFSVGRESPADKWEVEQIAGKKNAEVSEELAEVAVLAVAKMNVRLGAASRASTP